MRKTTIFVISVLSLLAATAARAVAKPAAQVTAAKGPVQITLSLRKTAVKLNDSVWYKLELKNIGKTKLNIQDLVFKNPWAMHENSVKRTRIYIEIVGPDGKPMRTQMGGKSVKYDWEPAAGEVYRLSMDETKELEALETEWKKRGLTDQERHVAYLEWNDRWHNRKNRAERRDPAKQLWLNPGASTATAAWVDRGIEEYRGRADDDLALHDGYAQLWSYSFLDLGTYRVRAVYDFQLGDKSDDARAKGWVTFRTPFIAIKVVQ